MELTWEVISILILFGVLFGLISTTCGIGGGVFFVTLLTLFFVIPIDIAIDTSTFIILIASAAGFITYYREGRVDLKASLIFGGFSIIGGLSCMMLLLFIEIDNTLLKFLFATTLLIAGLNMIRKALKSRKQLKLGTSQKDEFSLKEHDYKKNLKKSIPLFFLSGFLAYLLGIGGGIVNTPALNIVLGYPIHNATAMSTTIIFFTAIVNTIMKTFMGQINFLLGFIIAIGAVLGSIFGAKISGKIPKVQLQFLVAIVLMLLAIRMYF